MNRYYFTFGTDERYPFQLGYLIIEARDGHAAREIFKAYFPNRKGSDLLNCAFVYNEEDFMKNWDSCWKKSKCHCVIGIKEEEIFTK